MVRHLISWCLAASLLPADVAADGIRIDSRESKPALDPTNFASGPPAGIVERFSRQGLEPVTVRASDVVSSHRATSFRPTSRHRC